MRRVNLKNVNSITNHHLKKDGQLTFNFFSYDEARWSSIFSTSNSGIKKFGLFKKSSENPQEKEQSLNAEHEQG
jgi:hypothetical protein